MQCYWPIAEPLVGIAKVDKTKLNQWQRLSWRNVRSNWNDNQTAQFRFDFEGMASNTMAYIDDAMLIDLTAAFGAGNEPTQSWCDTNIEYFAGNTTIQYEAPMVYDLTSTTPTKIKTGDILNCPYSGSVKSITLPKGQYKLECWGAQGGTYSSYKGGPGGYSVGKIILTKKETLFFYVGGAGTTSTAAGFNGGGTGISGGRGGGGASDIRIGQDSLYARVIVAGGGGGAGVTGANANPAGCGGGLYGGDGYYNNTTGTYTTGIARNGGSASQTAGGKSWQTQSSSTGTFGKGGNASGYSCGGGGGGWYGGGGAYDNDSDFDGRWGGGGSGYVYTSSTASNYPSGCLLNSSYYLTNAQTIAGNTAFTSPTGTNETGHTGNGYIRITVIKASSGNTLVKTTSNTWKEQKQMFINTGASSTISSGLVELDYIESTGVQAIDTLVIAKDITKVVTDFQLVSVVSGTESQVMAVWSDVNNCMQCGSDGTNFMATSRGTTYSQTSNVLARTIGTSAPVGSPNISISIFAQNNTSWLSKAKLYSCKIYKDTTLIRDFIPAKRVSDGMCGLWDKVNYKFYTDINGNNFKAGAEKTAIAAIGTPIEYIQSSGTQYIETGISAKNITKAVIDFQYITVDSSRENQMMSVWVDDSNHMQCGLTGTTFLTGRGTTFSQTSNMTARTTGTSVPVGNPDMLIPLFAQRASAVDRWSIAKLYSCKMYNNSTIVRDFIPAKRISDNEYGLWDKVTKTFYTNAGTGAFTGGPAVTLSGWHKIKGVWAKTTADTWSQAL